VAYFEIAAFILALASALTKLALQTLAAESMLKLRVKAGLLCIIIAAASIFNVGCHTFGKTQRGAAIGAGTGAIVGGFIGKFAGNTSLGAIIGGAVGGTAGAFIGRNMDRLANDIDLNVTGASVTRRGQDIIVKFDSGMLFDPGQSDLTSDMQNNLKNLAESLKKNPLTDINIVGYTDSKGSPDYNTELSLKRANSVKAYMVSVGIDASRLNTAGKGGADPAGDNDTEIGRAKNRRVDITIVVNQLLNSQSTASSK